MTNIITAYCCCTICCGPHAKDIAANGKPPIEGVTCAGPRAIPLGTTVHIEGVGTRIVTDRTAKRFDGVYDVYFRQHKVAKRFGRRLSNVQILKSK